ncbi:hypothetical protein C8Q78DRAFT_726192 [Trametes maxima]|nr:hypothetical protein C8Q78DRAFT_726192 [Trametes maxima]
MSSRTLTLSVFVITFAELNYICDTCLKCLQLDSTESQCWWISLFVAKAIVETRMFPCMPACRGLDAQCHICSPNLDHAASRTNGREYARFRDGSYNTRFHRSHLGIEIGDVRSSSLKLILASIATVSLAYWCDHRWRGSPKRRMWQVFSHSQWFSERQLTLHAGAHTTEVWDAPSAVAPPSSRTSRAMALRIRDYRQTLNAIDLCIIVP